MYIDKPHTHVAVTEGITVAIFIAPEITSPTTGCLTETRAAKWQRRVRDVTA